MKAKYKLKIKKLDSAAKIPEKAYSEDAGFDLYSNSSIILNSGDTAIIKTGIAVEIPKWFCGIIKDRSGVAAKRQIETLAGVIDSSYRGEIGIVMHNVSKEPRPILKGEKIAQMLIVEVPEVEIEVIDNLSTTERGEGGFGSTGN